MPADPEQLQKPPSRASCLVMPRAISSHPTTCPACPTAASSRPILAPSSCPVNRFLADDRLAVSVGGHDRGVYQWRTCGVASGLPPTPVILQRLKEVNEKVRACTHTRTHIHAHAHTHIHAHTHAHTHARPTPTTTTAPPQAGFVYDEGNRLRTPGDPDLARAGREQLWAALRGYAREFRAYERLKVLLRVKGCSSRVPGLSLGF